MARINRLLKRNSSRTDPQGDRAAWMEFYKNTDELVEHEMQLAVSSDVQAALHIVESVHKDRNWSW